MQTADKDEAFLKAKAEWENKLKQKPVIGEQTGLRGWVHRTLTVYPEEVKQQIAAGADPMEFLGQELTMHCRMPLVTYLEERRLMREGMDPSEAEEQARKNIKDQYPGKTTRARRHRS